jgi:polyisoprenyl-teichoic acid--peptidoglycan teichoic acid transferase
MHENRNFKRSKKHLASIDGIVSNGQTLGQPVRGYKPNRDQVTPSLGGLARGPDGFRPARHTPNGLGDSAQRAEVEALLDEPIVLDDLGSSKKKHTHPNHRKHRKMVVKRAVLSLMALFLVGTAFLAIRFYITEKKLFRGGGGAPAFADDINKLKGEGDGRVNILLIGVGGPKHTGGDLADTIMLASIDPVNHGVALLSIPRDLWVKIPGDGYQKVNAAYAYGKQQTKAKSEKEKDKAGIDLLDKTLEPVLGVPIHYHSVVNFDAFKQTVNVLGGVKVNVPETLYDPTVAWENQGSAIVASKGWKTFNGKQALLYARSRETSSDFARGERQRLLLVAIKDKAFSVGTFSNPVKISNLMSSLGDNVYTDFSLNDMKRLYQIINKTPTKNISSLDLVKPPHDFLTTDNINGLSAVRPKEGLFEYDAIHNYVRNALRDGFLARENSQVIIYNATDTVGLATQLSKTLKSYGYNITAIGNTKTPTNPLKTKIVDFTKGKDKYTKHYLEERFKVKVVHSLPPGLGITKQAGTDFVIILGEDVATSTQN